MAHKLILYSLCARFARFLLYAVIPQLRQGEAEIPFENDHSHHPFLFMELLYHIFPLCQ